VNAVSSVLGTPPPWPLGLVTAVLAGVLLWSVTARLRLRPESRAASTAVYACCALLTELTTVDGVDGRATLLLAAGGMFAVAGARRSVLAALACVGAVALAPVVGVGVLVLLGAMALRKDLLTRFPAALRRLTGVAAFAAAAGVAALLARPQDGPAVPMGVLVVLGTCALLVGGVSWVRLPWLRPPVAAVVALVACQLVPGPDLDAVLPAAAGLAVLAAVLTEEHHVLLARPVLVGAVMAGVVATALLVPAIPLPAGSGLVGPGLVGPGLGGPSPVAEVVPALAPTGPRTTAVSIAIPRLDLSGPLDELGVAEDGELLAPDDPARAGWYAGGVVPGDLGPAIVGGHVDSRRGPGVFFALRSLRRDDVVEITRSDGRIARFSVTRVQQVAKEQFPTSAVYGPTARSELRLITCGGRFDRTAHSYTDNVVVEAVAL
jgi:hypothetical protein